MKSKVKSLTPYLENGNHGTWSKDGKTYWKFNIELEDGTKGTCLGANIQGPSYSVGSEVTYDLVDGKLKNIKKVNDFKPGGGYISHFEKPEIQRSITAAVSIKLGILACKSAHAVAKDDYFKMANAFYEWVYKDGDDSQKLLNRRGALEHAIEASTILDDKGQGVQGINSGKAIFEEAQRILDWQEIKNK